LSKIIRYIFNLSPRKLAIYLILGPIILFLIYNIVTIAIRYATGTNPSEELAFSTLIYLIFFAAIGLFVVLWLLWLYSTIYSVGKENIGLPFIWLKVATTIVIFYLLYNSCFSFIEKVPENFQDAFYMLNEFVAFGGLIIGYPIICNYSARAIVYKQKNEKATFLTSIVFTLLLIFGTVLPIPFFHKYFSNKTSTNRQIIVIYAIGLCVWAVLFVIALVAAITGLV